MRDIEHSSSLEENCADPFTQNDCDCDFPIAANGLFWIQWKCSHCAIVKTSPTLFQSIGSKNKSQSQVALCKWAFEVFVMVLSSRTVLKLTASAGGLYNLVRCEDCMLAPGLDKGVNFMLSALSVHLQRRMVQWVPFKYKDRDSKRRSSGFV